MGHGEAQGGSALHPWQGLYIDDMELPGMVWTWTSSAVRTRTRRSRRSIRREALKIPGVLAVITGKDLERYGLHWMPTLCGHRQMVLPTDTVMYQAQEVAAVIATARYAAADGVAAVEVEYDPLPVVVDPFEALLPDAPILRPTRPERRRITSGTGRSGDSRRPRTCSRTRRWSSSRTCTSRASTSPSIETCGCVADYDRVREQLTCT